MSPNAGAAVHRGVFPPGWGVGGGGSRWGHLVRADPTSSACGQQRLTSHGARHGSSDTIVTGFRYISMSPGATDPACCLPAGSRRRKF